MAINETIATGRKFRKLIDEVNKIWQRISFWTKAEDVEFNDGSTAEIKIGTINGVTDSLTSTASNVAASAAAVKALNDKVTAISSNITPNLKICGIAKPGGAPVTVPKAGCYIVCMSAQNGTPMTQPENTEIICEPTYFSVATIGVYLAAYMSTDVTSVVCTGSNYNYVQGAIVLAP